MKRWAFTGTAWILCLAHAPSAWAAPPAVTVTWTQEGRDAAGASAFERLEIQPSRKLILQTAARRGACSPEAGTYVGVAESESVAELATLAEETLREQRGFAAPAQASANPARVVWQNLEVEHGGEVSLVRLVRATDKTRRLDAVLDGLRDRTSARSVLRMHARKAGKHVRVSFEPLGDRPVRLLLPETAAEAFSGEGGVFRYARKPVSQDLILDAKSPRPELDLEWKGKTPPSIIRYSNAGIRHHARVDPPLLPSPAEAALCVTLR